MAVTWPRVASSYDRVNTSAHVTTSGSMALVASAVIASLKEKWCQHLAKPITLTASCALCAGGWPSLCPADLCPLLLARALAPLHLHTSGTGRYSGLFGVIQSRFKRELAVSKSKGRSLHTISVHFLRSSSFPDSIPPQPLLPLPGPTLGLALLCITIF